LEVFPLLHFLQLPREETSRRHGALCRACVLWRSWCGVVVLIWFLSCCARERRRKRKLMGRFDRTCSLNTKQGTSGEIRSRRLWLLRAREGAVCWRLGEDSRCAGMKDMCVPEGRSTEQAKSTQAFMC
jgi:hypothetical protein